MNTLHLWCLVVAFHQSRCQWPELSSLLGMFGLGGRGPGRGWPGGLPQLPGLREHREGLEKGRSQGATRPKLESYESPKSDKIPYGSLKPSVVHEDSLHESFSPDRKLAAVSSLKNSYKSPNYNPDIDSYGSPESSVLSSKRYQEKPVQPVINLKESPESLAIGAYEHLESPVPDSFSIDLRTSYKFPSKNQSPESPRVDNHDASVIYGSTKPDLSNKVNNPSLEVYPKNPSDSPGISETNIGNYSVEFASPRYPADTERPSTDGKSDLQKNIAKYKKHQRKESRKSFLLKNKDASTPSPVIRYTKPTKISKQSTNDNQQHPRLKKNSKRPNTHDSKPLRNIEHSRFSTNFKVSYKFPKNELQVSYKTPKRKPTKSNRPVSSKHPRTKSSKYPRGRYQGPPRKKQSVKNYPASTVPPSKPLPYRPPPLIEPAILGFHPLAPVIRPGHTQDNGRNAPHLGTIPPPRTRQPTYPPEEFIWNESLVLAQEAYQPPVEVLKGGFRPLRPSPQFTSGGTDWDWSPGGQTQAQAPQTWTEIPPELSSSKVESGVNSIFMEYHEAGPDPDFRLVLGEELVTEREELVINMLDGQESKGWRIEIVTDPSMHETNKKEQLNDSYKVPETTVIDIYGTPDSQVRNFYESKEKDISDQPVTEESIEEPPAPAVFGDPEYLLKYGYGSPVTPDPPTGLSQTEVAARHAVNYPVTKEPEVTTNSSEPVIMDNSYGVDMQAGPQMMSFYQDSPQTPALQPAKVQNQRSEAEITNYSYGVDMNTGLDGMAQHQGAAHQPALQPVAVDQSPDAVTMDNSYSANMHAGHNVMSLHQETAQGPALRPELAKVQGLDAFTMDNSYSVNMKTGHAVKSLYQEAAQSPILQPTMTRYKRPLPDIVDNSYSVGNQQAVGMIQTLQEKPIAPVLEAFPSGPVRPEQQYPSRTAQLVRFPPVYSDNLLSGEVATPQAQPVIESTADQQRNGEISLSEFIGANHYSNGENPVIESTSDQYSSDQIQLKRPNEDPDTDRKSQSIKPTAEQKSNYELLESILNLPTLFGSHDIEFNDELPILESTVDQFLNGVIPLIESTADQEFNGEIHLNEDFPQIESTSDQYFYIDTSLAGPTDQNSKVETSQAQSKSKYSNPQPLQPQNPGTESPSEESPMRFSYTINKYFKEEVPPKDFQKKLSNSEPLYKQPIKTHLKDKFTSSELREQYFDENSKFNELKREYFYTVAQYLKSDQETTSSEPPKKYSYALIGPPHQGSKPKPYSNLGNQLPNHKHVTETTTEPQEEIVLEVIPGLEPHQEIMLEVIPVPKTHEAAPNENRDVVSPTVNSYGWTRQQNPPSSRNKAWEMEVHTTGMKDPTYNIENNIKIKLKPEALTKYIDINKKEKEKGDDQSILYRMVDGAYQKTILSKEHSQVEYNLVSPTPVPSMRYLGYRRTETYPYIPTDRERQELQAERTFVTKSSEGIFHIHS